jgi:hypothetical protein
MLSAVYAECRIKLRMLSVVVLNVIMLSVVPPLLIIEGTTEKVLLLKMLRKSICGKNVGFVKQKCILEQYGEVKPTKTM